MKTLEDWLASSSSSSSSSSSALSASQPHVQKTEKVEIPHNNVQVTPEQKENVQLSSAIVQEQVAEKDQLTNTAGSLLLQNSAASTKTDKSSVTNTRDANFIKLNEENTTAEREETKYERVEVMVVDRGTQTVTTTSTQTDEPYFVLPCPQCNHTACLPSANIYTSIPTTLLHNRLQRGVDYVQGQCPTGIDGRPYRQLFDRFAQEQHKEATELLHQLEVIQNSVDMLISRYNLPPPPPSQAPSSVKKIVPPQESEIKSENATCFTNTNASYSSHVNN